MGDIFKWAGVLYRILKDGKVTRDELPEFLEALAGLVAGIVAVVLPFLKGDGVILAKRLSAGLKLAAGK